MKFGLICISIFTFSLSTTAQLTKDNWLVGGAGNFLSSKNTYVSSTLSSTTDVIYLNISSDIGYFIMDKLAAGLKVSYSKIKENVRISGLNNNSNRFEFGPFARYYFLNADKQYNIITDVSYQYGLYWFTPTKGDIHTFSASGGPVIFFNSSVGLEFLLGYYDRKEIIRGENSDIINQKKGFQMSIGFQIHLEK